MAATAATPGIGPVLEELRHGPVAVFVAGGVGMGKSTALGAVRRVLHDDGHRVLMRAPQEGDDPAAAVVVDDAHLLAGPQLQLLARMAEDTGRTMVVAGQLCLGDPDLRALIESLERRRPSVVLAPMRDADIREALSDRGAAPHADIVEAALAVTGGAPFLVHAVAAADPAKPDDVVRAAFHALLSRVRRLDQQDLEALLIATLSLHLGAADIGAALDLPGEAATALFDRVRGTELADHARSMQFRDSVHRAAAQTIGTSRHRAVESALLQTQCEASTLPDDLALRLAEHGLRDRRLVEPLRERAADEHDPARRARCLRAAVDCGATALRAELADALFLAGNCAEATAIADALLAAPEAADHSAGVRIAASVATHDGNTAYAAEVFAWLGPYPEATIGAAAAVVHTATGDLTAARAALEAGHSGPPTTAARSARALADALVLLTADGFTAASVRLGEAVAGEHSAAAVAMPDTAAALLTVAALNSGDSARARSVIVRALRSGAEPAYQPRHRLLQGWICMLDGQLAAASDAVDAAGDGLHARDALWAAALRTAIARRGGDPGALQAHLAAGLDVLAEYSLDLFSLLPLGELWMAAARVRQRDRLQPALEHAFGILDALGRPAAWAPLLHWSGVHAGILAGDPAAVAPHGQALTALADDSPFAAALAAAGRTWLQVLAGSVDADAVLTAARGLAGHGLTSDATRLAAQAALQAPDPKVSALMLQIARDLRLTTGDTAAASPEAQPVSRPGPAGSALSDREREVAELLLRGLPYRDIGAQLFISPKTVEHHVARIRRRLGAQSRSEMLSMLRMLLA